jgi:pimeloyl-ACP methyl ester carboxylesterase
MTAEETCLWGRSFTALQKLEPEPPVKLFNNQRQKMTAGLVLVPGWASDWRIFNSLNLEFDYLVPLDFSPFSFEKGLLRALKKKSGRVSLFGWSLGGFTAAGFAAKYPALIDELMLVSIRRRYLAEELGSINFISSVLRKKSIFLPLREIYSKSMLKNWS